MESLDQLPVIVRLPLRLLLALLSMAGNAILGLIMLVLAIFGIAIMAAYPSLPDHEQQTVLWGLGITVVMFLAGSMFWLWKRLHEEATSQSVHRDPWTASVASRSHTESGTDMASFEEAARQLLSQYADLNNRTDSP
ncbi:MAG: hypothetical protein KDA86_19960 [Planctomycetaceae bacterium]|nr:hypothetical protein [Planctomycetaceae bacterium]